MVNDVGGAFRLAVGTVVAKDVEGARRSAAVRKALVETRPQRREVGRVFWDEIECCADVGLDRFGRLAEERIG